jgi:hypothetical protein
MNDGMKIILERMKTHPEEFKEDVENPFAYNSKWVGLVHRYENNLPEEDIKAFKDAVDVMRQEEFTAKVMEELLDPKSEQLELDLNPRQTPRMPLVGQTLSPSIPSMTLEASEHLRAHLDALHKTKKEHKTIFGRLFNYT